jgi:imidazoleglycerol-phosphate dehydratase
MSRVATAQRSTCETQIELSLDLDGTGGAEIDTPVPFFNHMVEALAKHAAFDLRLKARGDVEIDAHHTVEDVGIVLGDALVQALGDRRGIARFGDAFVPMDETLAHAAIDLGGRAAFLWNVEGIDGKWVGTFDCELAKEFFAALADRGRMNLHLRLHYGKNAHHILEALFKATARALRVAVQIDPRLAGAVPSTKGSLTT